MAIAIITEKFLYKYSKDLLVFNLALVINADHIIGASLSEPHTSESFVGSSFYANIRQKTNLMPYKFLCDTKILCGIRNLLYMVVGSSVSRKPCDKSFPEWPYMVVGSSM